MAPADIIAKPDGTFTYLMADGRVIDLAFEPGSRRRCWLHVDTPVKFTKLALHATGKLYAVAEDGTLWERGRDVTTYHADEDPDRQMGTQGPAHVVAQWSQVARAPQ